jgi:hypothetical protein
LLGFEQISSKERNFIPMTSPSFRKLFLLLILPTALLPGILLRAQDKAPERKVQGNVVVSEKDPAIRIELPRQVSYVGGERWILFTVADCEIHVFVEANAQKNVQRFYWIQFEGFLPSKPELQHKNPTDPIAKLNGIDFFVKAGVRSNDQVAKAGSDLERVQNLIQAKGYKMPAGMMSVRLVHLLDDQRRKELMIIYGEDVAPTGFTATELLPGGKAYERWPSIEKDLIQRAEERFTFRKTAEQ